MKTITFFSFKGGVGRSSLLANLGAYWAAQGKQVAMMDLDLAAPGLSFLPQRGAHLEPEFSALGMSDVLSVFEQGFAETPKKLNLLPPSKLLREVKLPKESSGRLLLIEAGSCDWQRASEVPEGLLHDIAPVVMSSEAEPESERQQAWRQLAQAIYTDLSAWRHPQSQQPLDLLLIDCRTGFAELLDFSLSYLTERQDDHLVLVSALNEQNRAGLRQSLVALQQQNRVPVDELAEQVSVVFSPVHISEDEASLQALELGTQVINDCLRPTHSGAKERPPHFFVLHYNQILASSEALLSVTHPHSLYAEEVSKVADWLVGKQQHPDRTLKEISQRVGWEIGRSDTDDNKIPVAASKRYASKRPNPLSNLPAWHWPLVAASELKRQQALDKLMPANPNIELNRETLLNSLAFSLSLSIPEKKRVLEAWPRLSQRQVTELIKTFENERDKLSDLGAMHTDDLFALLHVQLPEWAVIVSENERQGWQRYLYPPLEGKSLFAYAEHWGEYWGGLAGIALAHFSDDKAAKKALEIAKERNSDPASVMLIAIKSSASKQSDRDIDWQLLVDWFKDQLSKCQDSNTLNLLGIAWQDQAQRYAEAEQAYRRALEIDPKYVHAWGNLGNLLSDKLQRYDEAEQAYLKALKTDPKHVNTWFGLGVLLHDKLQRYDEAEQAYLKALKTDPKHVNTWFGLGLLLHDKLQRYDEAEQAYRQAIEIYPKEADAWGNLGYLLANDLQRYEEAKQTCKDALDIDPKHANNWNILGTVQRDMGQCKDALHCWEQALNLDSQLPSALVTRTQLRLSLGAPAKELRADLASACQSSSDRQDYVNAVYSALALNSGSEAQKLLDKLKGSGSRWTYFCQWLYALCTSGRVEDHSDTTTLEQLKSHSDRKAMLEEIYYLAGFRPEVRKRLQRAARQLLQMDTSKLKGAPMLARREKLYTRFAAGESNGGGDPRDLALICNDASDNQQSNQP